MKKIFLVILSMLVVALIFQNLVAAEKIELSAYLYQDMPYLTQVLEEEFEKQHPEIDLDIVYVGQSYHQQLSVMASANDIPDILFLWPDNRTKNLLDSGFVKDLRPWLKGHEDEFVDGALASQGRNGEIYELPGEMIATHVMYTNEKLLENLGLTFPDTLAELISQGETIRTAGLIPIAMTNENGWQMQSCLLSVLTERAGGMDWYHKAVIGDGASFADQDFVEALSVIDALVQAEMFMPDINQSDYGAALTEFVNERAVYYVDGSWRVDDLADKLTDDQKTYISLNTFPEIPNQKGQTGSTSITVGPGFGIMSHIRKGFVITHEVQRITRELIFWLTPSVSLKSPPPINLFLNLRQYYSLVLDCLDL